MNNVWKVLSNLVGRWWRCGHVAVHSCRVHRETVETVEETCDWALTVTSRSLWTTSARRWCRLFPLHWWRGPSTVDRQVLRPWRPTSPTGTRSGLVWRSCVTSRRQSLQRFTVWAARWWLRESEEMRVLSGVVYMTKSKGPRTEPWGTPQEEICSEEKSLSHLVCYTISRRSKYLRRKDDGVINRQSIAVGNARKASTGPGIFQSRATDAVTHYIPRYMMHNWVRFTWRHRSRDHSIAHMPFPIGSPLEPNLTSISNGFRDIQRQCNATVDVTLIRPLNKGQGHSFWYQSVSHIRLPIGSP